MHPQPRKGWQDNSGKTHVKATSSDGPRFIVLHAGNENGWVAGASLLFRSKTQQGDYHNSMNSA
ncbi:hypothetical protein, partial [Staphylococcus aureus]|uniref:hypothetical protein n=1 Tax=Staphylococcus aureus TaxID=1280 RepID=UPI0038B40017